MCHQKVSFFYHLSNITRFSRKEMLNIIYKVFSITQVLGRNMESMGQFHQRVHAQILCWQIPKAQKAA